eukprot:1894662-Pyramimonas_sp.AAC.1
MPPSLPPRISSPRRRWCRLSAFLKRTRAVGRHVSETTSARFPPKAPWVERWGKAQPLRRDFDD